VSSRQLYEERPALANRPEQEMRREFISDAKFCAILEECQAHLIERTAKKPGRTRREVYAEGKCSSARPACGLMRRRLERACTVGTAAREAGIDKPLVVVVAMVFILTLFFGTRAKFFR
jgi:hypothetical protein